MKNSYAVVALLSCMVVQSLAQKVSYTLKDHPKLLLVSFDGLRWDYVSRRPNLTGFRYLQDNGIQAEYLIPPFPTLTSACHTTMATGLNSESHGVVHNAYYDINSSDVVTNDYYSTLGINKWWDNGQEPIWITATNQGLKSGGYLFPGSNATINGKTATRSILETASTLRTEKNWRKRVDDVMSWFIDDDFDFVGLYFNEPDWAGHDFGPLDERIARDSLPKVDRTINYLLKKVSDLGLEEKLNIIVTSDHGMTELITTQSGVINTLDYVNAEDIFFQFQYYAIGLVEPKPEKVEKVYNQLKGAHPHLKVFYKSEIPQRLHYANNHRVPSIVLFAELGYALYTEFNGIHKNKGHHGYDPNYSDMRASYFAIGPSFKKNLTIPAFETIHIYELMCHLLGLNPAPNNGSLDVLLPTLKDNSSKGLHAAQAIVLALLASTLSLLI